jgi:cell wall-associated NlpC family hydrolase
LKYRIKRPVGAVSVLVVAAFAVGLGATAPAVAATKYPSWAEVQKAEGNVTTKNAEVKKITAMVSSLQNASAAAGKVALISGEQYLQAKNALAAASTTANNLSAQASSAKQRARTSAREAGELAAQLARQGGGDVTLDLLMNGKDASNLLNSLGTASKLTQSTTQIFAEAEQAQKTASALSGQAAVAEKARSAKAATASVALTAANNASRSASAKVTAETKQQTVLSAQLASLKGVSTSVEAAYLAGVAWEAKQAAQKTPPPDGPALSTTPAQSGGGTTTAPSAPSGGGTTTAPPPSAPNGSAVAGAIRFAEAQLGKPYVLDGAGPNVWDCSGLTMESYAAVGIYIGTHSATNQYNTLRNEGKLVPLSDRQPGDILWYSDGGSTSATKYHVTIYIGNGEMIEAPYPGADVRIAAIRFGDLVPYAGRPTE